MKRHPSTRFGLFESFCWLAALAAHASANMNGADFPKRETVVYRQVGELPIKAEVFHFGDDRKRPAIVSFHGGALIMGNREQVHRPVREFARTNGYVLISFDYRLAPETKLPLIIEDVEAAFQWLEKEGAAKFHADPQRIAVSGGSAGGYLTLVTGYRVKPRPRALLAYFGYGDLIGAWYSTPSPHPRHNARKIGAAEALAQVQGPPVADARARTGDGGMFYNYCRQNGLWPKLVSGWDPQTERDKFYTYMPLKNVASDYPPTVLIHGTADTDVPFEQSELMVKEFQRHGVPFRFYPIQNAEHGLNGGRREEIEDAQQKAFEFLKQHLD